MLPKSVGSLAASSFRHPAIPKLMLALLLRWLPACPPLQELAAAGRRHWRRCCGSCCCGADWRPGRGVWRVRGCAEQSARGRRPTLPPILSACSGQQLGGRAFRPGYRSSSHHGGRSRLSSTCAQEPAGRLRHRRRRGGRQRQRGWHWPCLAHWHDDGSRRGALLVWRPALSRKRASAPALR